MLLYNNIMRNKIISMNIFLENIYKKETIIYPTKWLLCCQDYKRDDYKWDMRFLYSLFILALFMIIIAICFNVYVYNMILKVL